MKQLIGVGIILAAFAVLVASSMKSNTLRVVPVSELRAADAGDKSLVGQRLRVGGFVGAEPVRDVAEQTPSGVIQVHHFAVIEKNQKISVTYRDALPDTFKVGGPVQVDGLYAAPGLVQADKVFTKCPSKYEAESKAQLKNYGAK